MTRQARPFRVGTLMLLVAAVAVLLASLDWWVRMEQALSPSRIIEVEVRNALPGRPISGERLVRPDGTISLGFYGDVYVAGLTPTEVREKIAKQLLKHLTEEELGLVRIRKGPEDFGWRLTQVPLAQSEWFKVRVVRPNVLTPFERLWPFSLSVRVASLATLLIVLIGLPIAYLLARTRFFGKDFLSGLMLLPLVLPPTVVGFALLQIFGRRAPLGMWLESWFGIVLVFHWTGAVLASSVAAFPLFLIPARAAFEAVDPGLEDVARLLGRGEFSVFSRVTLPLAWRGLISGTVLAFARALGDFGTTLMVAGNLPGRTQTASLAIYDAVLADHTEMAWLFSALIAATSIAALALVQKVQPARGAGR